MKFLVLFGLVLLPFYSWSHINLVEVSPVSLDNQQNTLVFVFLEEGNTHTTTLEIKRRKGCLSNGNHLGSSTPADFQQTVTRLKEYVDAGETFLFGLHALPIPKRPNVYWAVNLKTVTTSAENHYVRSVSTDVGTDHCPYHPQ